MIQTQVIMTKFSLFSLLQHCVDFHGIRYIFLHFNFNFPASLLADHALNNAQHFSLFSLNRNNATVISFFK